MTFVWMKAANDIPTCEIVNECNLAPNNQASAVFNENEQPVVVSHRRKKKHSDVIGCATQQST